MIMSGTTLIFRGASFSECFPFHTRTQSRRFEFFGKLCFRDGLGLTVEINFPNSTGLKSVLEKLRFLDGLVRTVDLTIQIKLRFQIPPS